MPVSSSQALTASRIVAALGYTPAANGTSPSYYDFLAACSTDTLPAGMTFTRASSAWRFNSSGVFEAKTTDQARFTYDPSTLTARGIRIEQAATNLCLYSGFSSLTGWNQSRLTATINNVTAPDGTTAGMKLVEDGTSGARMVYRTITLNSDTYYTVSAFFKAGARTKFWINFCSTAAAQNFATAVFDLSGVSVSETKLGTTSGAILSSSIKAMGSGWYRCSMTCKATLSANTYIEMGPASLASGNTFNASGEVTYAGDDVSECYVWGAQVELGNVTTYIPTTTATVTRAADTGLITSGYPLADQTWVIRARTPMFTPSSGTKQVLFQVDDGTDNNRRVIYRDTSNKIIVQTDAGGVTQAAIDLGTVASDTDFVVSARYADNLFAASLNGAAIVTDLSGTNPLGLTTARVGKDSTGNHWNSTIRIIETRRTATDAELPLLCA